jgi:hypothetical protein
MKTIEIGIATYVKFSLVPKRLTLKQNPAIYHWLWFNFGWKEMEMTDIDRIKEWVKDGGNGYCTWCGPSGINIGVNQKTIALCKAVDDLKIILAELERLKERNRIRDREELDSEYDFSSEGDQ